MNINDTVAYWSGITDADSPAEEAAVALAKEVQMLRRQSAAQVEALIHYDGWFGDDCGCSDDPCPIACWGAA